MAEHQTYFSQRLGAGLEAQVMNDFISTLAEDADLRREQISVFVSSEEVYSTFVRNYLSRNVGNGPIESRGWMTLDFLRALASAMGVEIHLYRRSEQRDGISTIELYTRIEPYEASEQHREPIHLLYSDQDLHYDRLLPNPGQAPHQTIFSLRVSFRFVVPVAPPRRILRSA